MEASNRIFKEANRMKNKSDSLSKTFRNKYGSFDKYKICTISSTTPMLKNGK